MTKENKYYAPKIEEFSIGFECQKSPKITTKICNGKMIQDHHFQNYIIDSRDFFDYIILENYRVKYLDEDDIISLGFELSDKIHPSYGRVIYEKISTDVFTFPPRKETTTIKLEQGRIRILFWEENHYGNETIQLFYGKIKNKSELKRLLIQLGIIKTANTEI